MAAVKESPKPEEPTEIESLKIVVKLIQEDIKSIHNKLAEKNDIIEILTVANTDLINIDMKAISQDLRAAEVRLNSIGTQRQFDILREIEQRKGGPHMAYQQCKRFLEESGKEAQMVTPTLNQIKLNLEKISEKLKYIAEAQDATN